MRARRRVTIRDVAAAAGVSHQTVSRVLNRRPDVAEETRTRIWQIIEEMNYQPSAIARSLTQQRSLTLGIVTAGLKYVGPSRTLNGITKQAEALGYNLLLKELPDFHANSVQPLLNSLLERQVDGILWAVPEVGDNRSWLEEQLGEMAVPMIFLTMGARPGVSTIAIDNYAGGRIATEHLLQQGCRLTSLAPWTGGKPASARRDGGTPCWLRVCRGVSCTPRKGPGPRLAASGQLAGCWQAIPRWTRCLPAMTRWR